MHPKVNELISSAENWQEEMELLRSIALESGLTETFKWKQACYTFENNNLAIIGAFKDYVVFSFFKGALLEDTSHLLVPPGPNSQSVRMAKFKSVREINEHADLLKAYIFEAMHIEKAGLKVQFEKETGDHPQELSDMFREEPDFEKAFNDLTPGRQRAYIMFFNAGKQSKTREARIKKYLPRIMLGKGMNDCICGLSKRMPNCDGSHKQLD
jgi:uncharacterized protein YdeI (YjbR/CyaY-like superfamily)